MSDASALLDSHTPSASGYLQHPIYGSVSSISQGQYQAAAGAGIGSAQGIGSAVPHRSVRIAVPADDHNGDDAESISTQSSYSTYSSSSSNGSLHNLEEGGRHWPTKKSDVDDDEDDGNDDDDEGNNLSARQLFWTYVVLAPILLSILILFAGLLQILPTNDTGGFVVHWDRFGVGMIGWAVAFGLRTPIFVFVTNILKLNPYLCEWSTLVLGAITEETARLVSLTVLNIRGDFGAVYWLGLGWAGMETVYYIGQSLVYSSLLSDDDYRAVATATSIGVAEDVAVGYARMAAMPKDDDININDTADEILNSSEDIPTPEVRHLLGIDRPWWSLMGRTSSMMVHIGLGCWLGYAGLTLLVPAALIHAAIYVLWGVFMPGTWSVPAASYGTLMTAMATFLIGLALYGQIV